LHLGKEGERSLVKEKVLVMVDVSFGIVHLVVGSGDGNDDGFDIEEFLFGEGGRSSTSEANVGNLVHLPHFFLTEEIENMDIFL
jgi:hypothetical protein